MKRAKSKLSLHRVLIIVSRIHAMPLPTLHIDLPWCDDQVHEPLSVIITRDHLCLLRESRLGKHLQDNYSQRSRHTCICLTTDDDVIWLPFNEPGRGLSHRIARAWFRRYAADGHDTSPTIPPEITPSIMFIVHLLPPLHPPPRDPPRRTHTVRLPEVWPQRPPPDLGSIHQLPDPLSPLHLCKTCPLQGVDDPVRVFIRTLHIRFYGSHHERDAQAFHRGDQGGRRCL